VNHHDCGYSHMRYTEYAAICDRCGMVWTRDSKGYQTVMLRDRVIASRGWRK
jgi:hypothetical protein